MTRYSWYQGQLRPAPIGVKRRIPIIVQNLPVPFDRRVWPECQALVSAGYRVAVVCPKGSGDQAYEAIDIVELYKYRPYRTDNVDRICLDGQWPLKAGRRQRNRCKERRLRLTRTSLAEIEWGPR